MFRESSFLFFSVFPVLLAACAAEATTDSVSPGAPAATTPPPSASATEKQPSAPDAGTSVTEATIKLSLGSAAYVNRPAGASSFAYDITFVVANSSATDIVSIDEMELDFGAGLKVATTQPLCSGTFAVPAGSQKKVDVTIVVPATGDVAPANFSMKCGATQRFGGGEGSAPPTFGWVDPIAIAASGKTKSGSFSATGEATRQ
jgi:hypothetical protein